MSNLNPDKALIFRIVHVDNVRWILEHGMHCRNSPSQDPKYVNIGNVSLIAKRSAHPVPIAPGGTLSDYVPFYFTPYSIMMYNIHTGYGGIPRQDNRDIVIFVSSLHRLHKSGLEFVFTNQHAYHSGTDFYSNLADLKQIDWALLQSRNFKTSDADPGRPLRYQAEALIHRHMPISALLGVVCYNDSVQKLIEEMARISGQIITVKTIPQWYFI